MKMCLLSVKIEDNIYLKEINLFIFSNCSYVKFMPKKSQANEPKNLYDIKKNSIPSLHL